MKSIFKLFKRKSKNVYLVILMLSVVNSILSSTLMILINNTIINKPLPFFQEYNWIVFVVLLIFSFAFSKLFQIYMITLSNDILSEFEQSLIQKIRFATFEAFEKLGPERVYTAFGDTKALASIPQALISFVNSVVIAACGMVYMFWVSWVGGLSVLLLMTCLLIFYLVRNEEIEKSLNKLRDLQNDYHRYVKDFLQGFKEIKMSINRNEVIYNDFLKKNILISKKLNTETSIKYQGNELIGSYGWYILLGLILFALPHLANMSMTKVSGFVVILLFLGGPIASLISIFPFYTRIKIASERLNALEKEVMENIRTGENHGDLTEINQTFKSLKFNEVVYSYESVNNDETFIVGPLNFEVKRGEIVFITGGNGSGKSTFINLITGIYRAKTGYITLNGYKILNENHAYYCNQLTAIFTNFHLFGENYDNFQIADYNPQLDEYINLMKLENIIHLEKDKNRISTNLSKGQQKRLALILGLMENKQILILDEWAAEQDPAFREYFYKILLPHFRSIGKTIIAVTHDEAYFDRADRLIKFDFGKITSDKELSKIVEKIY